MARRPGTLDFDGWVRYVFDHRVTDPAWHFTLDAAWWNETQAPKTTIAYLTRCFEHIVDITAPYSDAQINQGLWFLCNSACSSHMFALTNESVPWTERQRCIQAMYTVYADLFEPRCARVLSHLDEPGVNPLNSICYMWWDVLPIFGEPDVPTRRAFDAEVLEVMARTLALSNDACREGALHGLGHWQTYYPEQVHATIDTFLANTPDLRPELRSYAQSAQDGCVL